MITRSGSGTAELYSEPFIFIYIFFFNSYLLHKMIRFLNNVLLFRDATKINKLTPIISRTGIHTGEGISPIKMSFASYESTNIDDLTGKSPLLIMHGIFGSKSNWHSLSKTLHLKTKRKVIALDARNHGDSPHTDEFSYYHMIKDINFFIKSSNMTNVALLGHSMGGRSMMLYSLNYPEFVDKLIVVDISPIKTSSDIYSLQSYFEIMENVTIDRNLTMSQGRREADQQISSVVSDESVRQFLLTNLVRTNAGFKWKLNLKSLAKAFSSEIANFPEITKTFDKPTLFIGGRQSDYLPPGDNEKILKYFPKASFTYLDAGHWVHAEKPHEFISIVTEFLEQ
ncbi:protein ABHD11-like [Cimex lectularius]|uniref:sn-1-specific diacylglycerol lipase ABHD11 n=1 Tax=Cimex lectularius TaxID=79782 RepID=A0A8I6TGP0_CIMLE|nr:protein ABHD11-like [Cimex lectularius]